MPNRGRVIWAVFKREFFSYFRNPTGYVFITLFVFLSAVAAFWQENFFLNNLDNLDQLNKFFPYLLIFLAPAITMGLWADERRQGTAELLLTLPASDATLVAGKYLAALGIYSVALVFSLSNVVVLLFLGSPDQGMLAATYFGYWLMGAALLALGLLASQLTENLTVAFVLGSVFCAVPVFLRHAGVLFTGRARRVAEQLSAIEQFRDLASGVITASSVIYFLSIALGVLYLSVKMTGYKRWPAQPGSPRMGLHLLVRAVALVAVVGSVTVLAGRLGPRVDVTSEQIHSLSAATRNLLHGLNPKQPVFIHAYLSPEVPQSYVTVRSNLVSMLREFSAEGRDRIYSRIIETVRYSPAARQARERYGIKPYRVPVSEESGSTANDIFLGLVFTCGPEEFVIPFFDRGLPVEYELMRSIRVVSRAHRRRVGILNTRARLFGGLDFQTKHQYQDWSIIAELRKQYEVVKVLPDYEYPKNLDVLIAALPSTLTRQQLERLTNYVKTGKPVLVLFDPLPAFNPALSPAALSSPVDAPGSSPRRPSLAPLLAALGIQWQPDRIVWDQYNPHPQLHQLPEEIIFVSRGSQAPMPFQASDEITSGLQEVVMIYAGVVKPRKGDTAKFVPLMTTGPDSGLLRWNRLVRRTIFGTVLAHNVPHNPDKNVYVLAARLKRGGTKEPLNAVVVMDVDMMGQQFFELRRQGVANLNFDNVTFLLNAVDELAGDRSFIALRKRRPKLRTLETVEARTRTYEEKRRKETEQAQVIAQRRLAEAKTRLEAAVAAIEHRTDLDEQTRRIMISNVRATEERRLQVARANIEDARDHQIENARISMETSVKRIQNTIKLLAVALPPIPAFLILIFVWLRKLKRERLGISPERMSRRPAA